METTEESKGTERKAGVLVRGRNAMGESCWLMPVVEGRFAFSGEYLVPPKGAVDPGETELQAGLRELGEETGFWLSRALTAEQMSQLEAGEDLKNIPVPGHPDVIIRHFHAKPHRGQYMGRGGHEHSLAMFDVEVDGIDRIQNLKNKEGKTTKQLMQERPNEPGFRDFFGWLCEGKIPGTATQLVDPQWFHQLLETYAPGLLESEKLKGAGLREVWKGFNKELERNHNSDYQKLNTAYVAIKDHAKKMKWTGGDDDVLKIDTRDTPLYRYAEGARVIEERTALAKIFYDMSHNEDYNEAIGGLYDLLGGINPSQRILASQLTGLVPFADANTFQLALEDAVRVNGGKPLSWTTDPKTQISMPITEIAKAIDQANAHNRRAVG